MSSHWYTAAGLLVTQVPNKAKGGMRDADVDDAIALGLFPSSTTVLDGIRKYGLDNWKQNNVRDAVLALRHEEYTDDDFWAAVLERADNPNRSDVGTRFHAAIEGWLKKKEWPTDEDLGPIFFAFSRWWKDQRFESAYIEHPFCVPEWGYGGTTDNVLKNDRHYIVDWTTQLSRDAKGKPRKLVHYPEKKAQVVSYYMALRHLGVIKEKAIPATCVVAADDATVPPSFQAMEEAEVELMWADYQTKLVGFYLPSGRGHKLPKPPLVQELIKGISAAVAVK